MRVSVRWRWGCYNASVVPFGDAPHAFPVPGMNPYLEQDLVWQDFHQTAIPVIRAMLAEQVRPRYIVKVEVQLFIHELDAEQRRLLGVGDVGLTLTPALTPTGGREPAAVGGVATDTLEAPAYAMLPTAVETERHAYIEIRDRQRQSLVTVIELLSPANKDPGPDREQYLSKRRQILTGETHLVEIDLRRGGRRMPGRGPAPLRLLRDGQPRRSAAAHRHLAHPAPRTSAVGPDPAAVRRCRCDLGLAVRPASCLRRRRLRGLHPHGRPPAPARFADAVWARGFIPSHSL